MGICTHQLQLNPCSLGLREIVLLKPEPCALPLAQGAFPRRMAVIRRRRCPPSQPLPMQRTRAWMRLFGCEAGVFDQWVVRRLAWHPQVCSDTLFQRRGAALKDCDEVFQKLYKFSCVAGKAGTISTWHMRTHAQLFSDLLAPHACTCAAPGKATGPCGWGLGGEPRSHWYHGGAPPECAAGAEVHARTGKDSSYLCLHRSARGCAELVCWACIWAESVSASTARHVWNVESL